MATAESTRLDREALRQLNLYEVLQISPKASPEVVQAAYRVLARIYHPDVNASPHAARMMRQLNAAYKVLSDPERRSRYDAQRAHQWRARASVVSTERIVRGTAEAANQVGRSNGARSVVLPTSPLRTGWRIGRLLALIMVMMAIMGTLLLAFWMIAGALEDDPHGLLRASAIVAQLAS